MAASSDELPIIMVGHNRRFLLAEQLRWLLLRKNPLVIQYKSIPDLSLSGVGLGSLGEEEGSNCW